MRFFVSRKSLVNSLILVVSTSVGTSASANTASDYASAQAYLNNLNLSQQVTDSVSNSQKKIPLVGDSVVEQSYYENPTAMESAGSTSLTDSNTAPYLVEKASINRPESESKDRELSDVTDAILDSESIVDNPESVLIDSIYCSDGNCTQTNEEKNNDFSSSITELSAVSSAAGEAKNSSSPRLFSGYSAHCRDEALGALNCCSNKGWAHGILSCNTEENNIGKAKEDGSRFVYLGRYCSHKSWGFCTEHKQGYCVFPTRLAYDMQVRGGYYQLHKSFGSAENPLCSGLNISEMSQLNLDNIDFSNIEGDITANTTIPKESDSMSELESKITARISSGVTYG